MVREQNGRAIFWNGHLCEGDRMVVSKPETFILWTRCGKQDVPAGHARELEPSDHITCPICRQFLH
jgi:hypothetical protein